MSRFLPLLVFVIWMSSPAAPAAGGISPLWGCAIFLGFHAIPVALLALWSRRVASTAHFDPIQQRLRRFNATLYIARLLVPAWMAVGVFLLGWKSLVIGALSHTFLGRISVDFPGLIVGCLPSFAAWMALWWAQFPADQALKEQNILIQLNENLPFHPPPNFRTYFFVNLRLQLLFTIAPALVLVLLHDVLSLILPPIFHHIPVIADRQDVIEALISLPTFAVFLLFSPEILRRVLQTERMPDCPLRRRLENIARRNGVGFRDVLLWKTRYQMGNAAVMGFVPRFRYVLLSDLLLETMTDEQIEAIFAHELGHVMHRHLYWLVAAMAALVLAISGPGEIAANALSALQRRIWLPDSVQMGLLLGAALGLFALVFGYVSRKFERQADVFAARTIQRIYDETASRMDSSDSTAQGHTRVLDAPATGMSSRRQSHVGPYGAEVFCSALERVAAINNIPIAARSWCHGSLAKRILFLEGLSLHADQTAQFDRVMGRLYVILVLSLCVFAAWTMLLAQHEG
jgi:STE24 endopeptidase